MDVTDLLNCDSKNLLDFPAEIIEHIFSYVGPDFFRWNTSRLTVNRQWHIFAQNELLREVSLHDKNLDLLGSHLNLGKIKSIIQNIMESVKLRFEGYYHHREIREAIPMHHRKAWIQFNHQLATLVDVLRECRKFHRLSIHAAVDRYFSSEAGYLDRVVMNNLLTVRSLTHLDLDLETDVYAMNLSGESHPHLCTSIANQLPTLVDLRLRMRRMCAHALKPPQAFDHSLPLRTVIIFITSAERSTVLSCHNSVVNEELFDLMQAGLETLMKQMAEPGMVRLLSHVWTENQAADVEYIQGYDLLEEKCFKLDPDGDWTDEGEELPGDVTEALRWDDGQDYDTDPNDYANPDGHSLYGDESLEEDDGE